jgi:hypothetical protein
MNRNEKVKTLSYSFIELNNAIADLKYLELQTNLTSSKKMDMKTNMQS